MACKLEDYAALTFDCYGTLIDWESGIWDALQPLLMTNKTHAITRDIGLEAFAELESDQQASTPKMLYPELLSRVHARFADRFKLTGGSRLDKAFGQSVPAWPAFPDSADALRLLANKFQLVILSNVDRGGFDASSQKLGAPFDAIYTAEDVGSYKPNPQNFEYMISHIQQELDIPKNKILHVAQSLFHDHVPATTAGLDRAWIDRQGLSSGGWWGATAKVSYRPEVDFLFPDLISMAKQSGAD